MPKRKKPEPAQPESTPEFVDQEAETTTLVEPTENGNGDHEPVESVEEPAKMKVQMEGTAGAVRAAARKLGHTPAPPPIATPANDVEPPVEDNTDQLLADPKNMVIVQRQLPKSVVDPATGKRVRTGVRLPEPYSCPTTREEIENDVFDRFGGFKYKCSIHPATTNGANTLLGAFTIEHPDGVEADVYLDGEGPPPEMQIEDPRTSPHTRGGDSTMHETDQLAGLRDAAERRLARARAKKEALELEAEAKRLEAEIESVGKPVAPLVSAESEELKKLRAELAEKERLLSEKKVNDRFDKIESSLGSLAEAITKLATAKPAAHDEGSLVMKMLEMSQKHSKDLVEAMKATVQQPTKPVSDVDNFDKMLDRVTKIQTLTGTGASAKSTRSSELEEKMLDFAWEKMMGGDGGDVDKEAGDPYEDVLKSAFKEFAPIAKLYVEKSIRKESEASGGGAIPKETMDKIYAEAGAAAAKKVQDDLLAQGLQLVVGQDGKLHALQMQKKFALPPRKEPGSKVVSETKTGGGVVKKVVVEPHDLSKKPAAPKPTPPAAAPKPPPSGAEEEDEVKHSLFPGLGENGADLKIRVPEVPGSDMYSRKESVDFVLAGIRSDIRQGIPDKIARGESVENFVVADALQYLDDDVLNKLEVISDGPKLEALLGECGGDAKQIDEIKKAGETEVVAGYLRSLISAIQREWIRQKAGTPAK